MSERFYIEELPDDIFTTTFNIIEQYQRKDSILTSKLKTAKYKCYYFQGSINTMIYIIICENRIVILQKLQNM